MQIICKIASDCLDSITQALFEKTLSYCLYYLREPWINRRFTICGVFVEELLWQIFRKCINHLSNLRNTEQKILQAQSLTVENDDHYKMKTVLLQKRGFCFGEQISDSCIKVFYFHLTY